MEKIYSKVEPETVLHMIHRYSEFNEGREDLVEPNNYIQCASLKLNKGTTFKPHYHNIRPRTWDIISQESWHVIKGSVKCIFYDLDHTIIATPILYAGDSSFTLRGGHTYLILEDETEILEYKTGIYEGHDIDKTQI